MPASLDVFTVCVNARTTWCFFKLSGPDGQAGLGEATVNARTEQLLDALPVAILACNTCKLGLGAKLDIIRDTSPKPIGQAIASALEQAWLDRLAQESGQPLYVLLGGRYRESIPTYANINRGTQTREPEEFALRAQAAVDKGYTAIKMAPFDDVRPDTDTQSMSHSERSLLVQMAYKRIAAVAEQVGQSAALKIDCHSRLQVGEVAEMIEQMAEFGVTWFEEPVCETTENIDQIVAFRKLANARGILLAGAENSPGLNVATEFMRAGCYDVIMPDIILAGGPMEVVRIGHHARVMKCAVSLHNPCGPVMDVISAHVAAALPSLHSLERQYDESPLYDEIVDRKHTVGAGEYFLADVPGSGCSLISSHPMVKHRASYSFDI